MLTEKREKIPKTPSTYVIIIEILIQRHQYSAKNVSHPNLMIKKGFYRKYKNNKFYHISTVHVHTGVCAYVDATLLILNTFERFQV